MFKAAWNRHSFFLWVCCFEGGLALAGWTLGRLTGTEVTAGLAMGGSAIGQGIAATLPMVMMLWWVERSKLPSLVEIREMVAGKILVIFRGWQWWQFAVLSIAAGAGEEILFRGWMQQWLTGVMGIPGAMLATSIVFALVHLITPAYGWITFGISLYLGLLYAVTDNLAVPMIAHGLYDFVALMWLMRKKTENISKEE